MDSFLKNFGLFAIFFAIVYGYKKIQDYYQLKRLGLHENEKVYRAAGRLARGASFTEIEALLRNCPELDAQDVERILSGAAPHRTDGDGGYRAFLRCVNRAMGEEIYDERKRPPAAPEQADPPIPDTSRREHDACRQK